MSGKRQATSDLNHDNWDKDEEPEEKGVFRIAPEDELKHRVIKKARRKVTTTGSSDASDGASATTNKSVFSGFSGFGKTTSSNNAAASPFSFLSKIPAAPATTTAAAFSFGGTTTEAKKASPITASIVEETKTEEKSSQYHSKLRQLNQAVADWIKVHVDKNSLCILTPIFKDYENHLKNIEKEEETATSAKAKCESEKPASSTTMGSFKFSTTSPSSFASTAASTSTAAVKTFSFSASSPFDKSPAAATTTTNSTGIFGGASKPTSTVEPTKTNGFSFGIKKDDKDAVGASLPTSKGFSFGKSDADDKKTTTGFSFTPGATPFSFGNIQPPAAAPPAAKADDEDEEDKPPKVEFKQVVEDDAVYSKKCKVFVKKDGNFVDRGVGTLYLKPVKDSDKTQLLVRADTNLGNILINLILSSGIPTQRMGKNNVMMVCLPMPDVEKATPMLLRVKTGEDADELLATLEKYKK